MNLTVAICTWNRADLLRETLGALLALEIPAGVSWELIVVNNNCTDHTDSVLEHFQRRLPLRRVFEAKPGLSNARNAAVAAACGEYIIWTDDDVLVGPQWLAQYAHAARVHPDADILGGPVEPWFDGTPPLWLSRGFDVVADAYAARRPRNVNEPMTGDDLPFGANMVVRRASQVRHPYDPLLGRSPGKLFLGEDSVVLLGILREGGRGYWVPDAKVRHFIPRSRQNLLYLVSCWRGSGLTTERLAPARGRFRLLRSPGWLWVEAISATARTFVALVLSPPERWLLHMRLAVSSWGRLEGAWRGS